MAKKKRVLAYAHYYLTYNRGGGEIMLHEILRHMVKLGYDVDAIATTNKGPDQIVDGVHVKHEISYKDINLKDYDIIVTHFSESFNIVDAARLKRCKIIYLVHNTMPETKKFLTQKRPELAIFNTEWVKDFHNWKGNSIVIHPPVYADEHATTHGNRITLVNLTPPKGSNMFYNMAHRLPQYKFLGVEGGYWKSSQQYIKKPNIAFQPNTDNMKEDVWARTKILLVPSLYESYGMVAIEALASGIPVIASSTPGLKESLSYAGIFPQSNKVGDWKHEIIKLMSNEDYYNERSQLALKRSSEADPQKELELLAQALSRLIS